MSILIKMEMPKRCWDCFCFDFELDDCLALGGKAVKDYDKRRDDCPLIELPTHGDLIDRSKLGWTPIDITDLPLNECLPVYLKEDVDNAPAVIESEE